MDCIWSDSKTYNWYQCSWGVIQSCRIKWLYKIIGHCCGHCVDDAQDLVQLIMSTEQMAESAGILERTPIHVIALTPKTNLVETGFESVILGFFIISGSICIKLCMDKTVYWILFLFGWDEYCSPFRLADYWTIGDKQQTIRRILAKK